VKTAVMIRGWAHRQTMKRHCLIPRLSSKENEENTGQAMVINDARSSVESKAGTSVESIGDTPMLDSLQPHRLPVPRQTVVACGV